MRNGNKQKNNFIPNVQSAGKEGKIYCAPISTRGENEFIVQFCSSAVADLQLTLTKAWPNTKSTDDPIDV